MKGAKMPFKSEKIKIQGTKYDARRKLSEQDKQDIREYVGLSNYELARMYGVSKRLIQFIKYPERHKKNLEDRAIRGGSMAYYDKEKQREYMKKHRKRKQQLYIEGKIK